MDNVFTAIIDCNERICKAQWFYETHELSSNAKDNKHRVKYLEGRVKYLEGLMDIRGRLLTLAEASLDKDLDVESA